MNLHIRLAFLSLSFLASVFIWSCGKGGANQERKEDVPLATDSTSQAPASNPAGTDSAAIVPIEPVVVLPPPPPPVVLPLPALPPPLPPLFGFSSGGGGGRRGNDDDDNVCGNNVQEANPTRTRCSGLLYGVVQELIGSTVVYTLVRINQVNGSLTNVGTLDLASELPNIDRIAGIDFDAAGNLYLVAGNFDVVQRYSIDCRDASITFSAPIFNGTEDTRVDGLTIDTQGVAFTIINDNNNFGERLTKFGYENVMGLDTYVLDPALSNISIIGGFLGLGAIGFPSPDTLHSVDDQNDCIINKDTRATTCTNIASFQNFPGGFVFGYVDALDQDYESLVSYVIVVDSNSGIRYLASVNFDTQVITNITAIGTTEVVALAVNQTYEECDQATLMEGTACENCFIIEADCSDQIDNDMNGATDCEDEACQDESICQPESSKTKP